MRKLLITSAFLAVLGLAALTPHEASAFGWRSAYYSGYAPSYYYTPSYYGSYSYYAPVYSSAASYYYTPSYYGGYGYSVAPAVSSYYAPSYGVYPAGTSYYSPSVYDYAPIYSGPRYFQGYAPNRLWIYP